MASRFGYIRVVGHMPDERPVDVFDSPTKRIGALVNRTKALLNRLQVLLRCLVKKAR